MTLDSEPADARAGRQNPCPPFVCFTKKGTGRERAKSVEVVRPKCSNNKTSTRNRTTYTTDSLFNRPLEASLLHRWPTWCSCGAGNGGQHNWRVQRALGPQPVTLAAALLTGSVAEQRNDNERQVKIQRQRIIALVTGAPTSEKAAGPLEDGPI